MVITKEYKDKVLMIMTKQAKMSSCNNLGKQPYYLMFSHCLYAKVPANCPDHLLFHTEQMFCEFRPFQVTVKISLMLKFQY